MSHTTLLLVDDNKADSDYIITLLKEVAPDKFKVITASNMVEALEVIQRHEVEIITLDLFLPDSQGLGTLLAIRVKAPDTPVVIVSGMDDQHVTRQAMYYGAQAYLVKGEFDGPKLFEAMVQAIARQSHESLDKAVKLMKKNLEETKHLTTPEQTPAEAG